MPEMLDTKFKTLHDALHECSRQLKDISNVLLALAEALHTFDNEQTRLDNEQ